MTAALGLSDTFWFENRRRTYACCIVLKVAQSAAPLLHVDAVPDSAGASGVVSRHFPLLAEGPRGEEPGWMSELRDRFRRLPPADLAVVGDYCDATGERFAALAAPPEAGEPEWLRLLRGSLRHFARRVGSRDASARDDLLNTAAVLWLDAVRPRRRPKERGYSVPEDLAFSMPRLRGPGWASALRSVVNDGLRLAEDPTLPSLHDADEGRATRRQGYLLIQWRRLLKLSLRLLPGDEGDGERWTQAHFQALADLIRRELPKDKNIPRTVEYIAAVFYLFCKRPAGAVVSLDEIEEAVGADEVEQAEGVIEVAPEAADELMRKAKRLVRDLRPVDQAILAHVLGIPSLIGPAARAKLPPGVYRAILDRARLAAALGHNEREFRAERARLWQWWTQNAEALRPAVTPAEEGA